MDASRAKDFRSRICSTKELTLHCQRKINISFDGYDDDPRELFEIDEVKQYVALLDEALPELFFFSLKMCTGPDVRRPGEALKSRRRDSSCACLVKR